MIRFPPTSIALSENDIDFHLREIQIKEQLYAQGFSRKEVQRYYTERHGNANGYDVEEDVASIRAPSIITGKTGEDKAQDTKSPAQQEQMRKASDAISARTASSSENVKSSQRPSSTFPDPTSSSPTSIPSSPPVAQISLPFRHAAVRQSSLLRIMHTAGSQPSTASKSSSSDHDPASDGDDGDETEIQAVDFLQSPATRMRSYRPRSKTYAYIESEADPPTPPRKATDDTGSSPPFTLFFSQSDHLTFESAEQLPRQQHNHLDVPSSPPQSEADISSPLTLPAPFSINRRTASSQFSLPYRTKSFTPLAANPSDDHHQSSPLLPPNLAIDMDRLNINLIDNPPTTPSLPATISDRSVIPSEGSPTNIAPATDQLPSTPPEAETAPHEPPSSAPPSAKTPIPPRTEPRSQSRRYHGTFGVYNDRLPAEMQPQTPADLQSERQRAIAARNVAYTAPPGQIRTAGRLVGSAYDGGQGGVQSPTARAAMIRQRRAREFGRWRTVRMETWRGRGVDVDGDDGGGGEAGRFMTLDRAATPAFPRRRIDGMEGEDEEQMDRRLVMEWALISARPVRQTVDWRDEFDEDRVGEENFEFFDLRVEERMGRGRGGIGGDGDEEFAVMARTPTGGS